jgi:hypothetical protein
MANDFWGGAAAGVGSTLLFQGVRHAYEEKKREEQQLQLQQQQQGQYIYVPPPPPPHHPSVQQQLELIKKYCNEGLFTPDECNAKRQQILNSL